MSDPSPSNARSDERPNAPLDLALIGFDSAGGQGLINGLRNTGLAVHPRYAEDRAGLDRLTADGGEGIYLIDFDSGTVERDHAVAAVRAADRHAALIFVADDPVAALATASALGARDVVHRGELQRLAFLLRREQADQSQRRASGRLAERLDETEHRCRLLIDTSRDAIAYVHAGMHVHANPVYAEMFGFSRPSDLDGLPVMDLIAPDDRAEFKRLARREIDDEDREQCRTAEVGCTGADGRPFRAAMEFRPAVVDSEPCTQIVIRDTAPHRALEEKISELSSRDVQTGLYNRHFFLELLGSRLARDQSLVQVLMRVSIAGFAGLREQLGMAAADRLIGEVAGAIDRKVGDAVVTSRFGEHDFLLLSEDLEGARALAEDLLQALSQAPYSLPADAARPELTVAVALSDQPPVSGAAELVNHVLRAGSQAEHGDGERLVFAHRIASAVRDAAPDADLVAVIDRALANDGFRLNYQPIVSLQGDSREYYAVLVRLADETDEGLLPAAFIDQARRSGRLADIDRWVIRHSTRELARLQGRGRRTHFFVNLSDLGLRDDALLLWVCDCLREFRAKASWLTFQFNDIDLRNHPDEAQRLFGGLKKLGCRTSVNRYRDDPQRDDLLQRLPVDTIKIAPELTTRLDNEQYLRQLERLNRQLQEAGKATVATAVENAASLALLWQMRVSFLQGFFLQHPEERIFFGERL